MNELSPKTVHPDNQYSHWVELKKRLKLSLLALLLVMIPFAINAQWLFGWFSMPLIKAFPQGSHLVATDIVGPLWIPLKTALWLAFFVTAPFVFYQIWAFIAPALYTREKKLWLSLLAFSAILFYLGIAFAYCWMLPVIFNFLIGFTPEHVQLMTDIRALYEFTLHLCLAFGLAFETPIVVIMLVRLGIRSTEQLAKIRPYFIIGAFAVGMILTPPDIISQTLLALPLCLLFECGLLLAKCLPHAPQPSC